MILEEILPAAPDVPIQIAHLWGGADISEEALGVLPMPSRRETREPGTCTST